MRVAACLAWVVCCVVVILGQAPAPVAGPEAPVDLPLTSQQIRIVKSVDPSFPREAIDRHIVTVVHVKVLVDEMGNVAEADAPDGDPLVRPAALEAAREWKFGPLKSNGRTVRFTTHISFPLFVPAMKEEVGPNAWIIHVLGSAPSSVASGPSADAVRPTPQPSAIPDSTNLKLISSMPSAYPPEAAQKGLRGEVVLKVLVNERGEVERADVVSGDAVFVPAAMTAIRTWRFEPFFKHGQAVKVITPVTFKFAPSADSKPPQQPSAANTSGAIGGMISSTPVLGSDGVPQRVRVSQGVAQGLMIHRVQPSYPPDARRARIQGTVVLFAVIGKDGTVQELKLVSGHPMLVDETMRVVKQWRYKPYMLNGVPVEVETQITVSFTLAG